MEVAPTCENRPTHLTSVTLSIPDRPACHSSTILATCDQCMKDGEFDEATKAMLHDVARRDMPENCLSPDDPNPDIVVEKGKSASLIQTQGALTGKQLSDRNMTSNCSAVNFEISPEMWTASGDCIPTGPYTRIRDGRRIVPTVLDKPINVRMFTCDVSDEAWEQVERDVQNRAAQAYKTLGFRVNPEDLRCNVHHAPFN